MSSQEIIGAVDRIVRETIRESEERFRAEIGEFRREMLGHFDGMYQRLDRLEAEYQMISLSVDAVSRMRFAKATRTGQDCEPR